MKRIIVGDIHGGWLGFRELLDKFNYDSAVDEVISVGDLCDGWPDSKKVINFFMTTKGASAILGNHDDWLMKFVKRKMRRQGFSSEMAIYFHHGGMATIESFGCNPHAEDAPDVIAETPEYKYISRLPYYLEVENADGEKELVVHAGFNHQEPIEDQTRDTLCWDRTYVENLMNSRKIPEALEQLHSSEYKTIYIGHTPTIYFHGKWTEPMKIGQTWLLDTGAAFDGKMSGIDILSGEIQQSTELRKLYPDHKGRNSMTYNHELEHHTKKNNLNE